MKRVRACGRGVRDKDGVTVRVTETAEGRRAGFAGLVTCGSYWVCPECSAKIAAHNRAEIEQALHAWTAGGRGKVALATFTVQHTAKDGLDTVWDAVSAAWTAATSGKGWKDDQRRYGSPTARLVRTGRRKGELALDRRIWALRVTETTVGRNGWHVHVHALLFLGPDADDTTVEQVTAQMFTRWRAAAHKAGLGTPSWKNGRDGRLLHGDPAAALGEYFTKAAYTASHEVASGMAKSARAGNRTPFGVLRDLITNGEARDLALWQEWERHSRGRRSVSWSPGLRDAVGLGTELTDEEKADLERDGSDVGHIDQVTWKVIVSSWAWLDVLHAFEVSDAAGLALLARWQAAAHAEHRAHLTAAA